MDDVKHSRIVKTNNNTEENEEDTLMKYKESNKEEESAVQLIKSTMYLMYSDKAAVLLVFITLHYGMIQGLARGLFNASWVSCALGEYSQ